MRTTFKVDIVEGGAKNEWIKNRLKKMSFSDMGLPMSFGKKSQSSTVKKNTSSASSESKNEKGIVLTQNS